MTSGQIARAYAFAFACAGALGCGAPEQVASGVPLPALPPPTLFREHTPARFAFSAGDLSEPFATPSARIDPVIRPNIHDAAVFVPPGFSVETFVTGLAGPRRAIALSNGDLIVSESFGLRISLLRDTTGDGRPDRRTTLLQGRSRPYGIALHGDHLYMGFEGHILRARYREGALQLEGKLETLAALPSGGHWTRDIAIAPDGSKLFVSVGSRSNFNRKGNEPLHRAVILEMNLDGSAARVFASGLRNPVSLLFHPATGALYTVVSERDGLGDDLPPDFLTAVRDGGFYGWPEAYIGPHAEPRLPAPDPARVAAALNPDVLLQAHSSPMGLVLYDGDLFPKAYRGDLFVAFHGSYNRTRRTGYKVVRVPMDEAGRPVRVNGVAGYEDFATGWSEDPASIEVWGRPAGVAQYIDGSLLVLDDAAGSIWRIGYRAPDR